MSRLDLLKRKAESIKSIVEKFGANNVRVFGSTVYKKDVETSDIDLLVDWNKAHSLFDHIELQQTLEDFLGAKVDLVIAKNIHWYVRDRIFNEAVSL